MTKKIVCHISNPSQVYEIEIGHEILQTQSTYLRSLASKFALIVDDTVAALYGKSLHHSLRDSGLDVGLFSFSDGEQNKTRATKEKLEDLLLKNKFSRDSCVIALGGGVVTDMAGYLAATFCRGIPLVMAPTSLLGMVDASIGGKNGVNVSQGKNMLGCIYQPKKVILDLWTLKSLPKKEMSNGFVEMIKHGIIANKSLFEDIEKHLELLQNLDGTWLKELIFESCCIKNEIVEQDEKDKGKRLLLNFGHTIGHALETITGFTLSHGEAVAIGIMVESYISVKNCKLDQKSLMRIKELLRRCGFSFQIPSSVTIDSVMNAIASDKKSVGGKPRFVLIQAIGVPAIDNSTYCFSVEESVIKQALNWMKHDLCGD